MAGKKVLVSRQRFARMVKRLAKLRPGTAAAKRLRALSQSELTQILKTGGKRAAESAVRGVKIGTKKLDMIQRSGTFRKWRTPVALGIQAVEIWLLASKVKNRTVVKHKTVRPARASAKKVSRR